jgi:hypothetical protein
LVLALIGFFVCMYQGAEAMLGWMPRSWGTVDDGEFVWLANGLASLFAFGVGMTLAMVLDKSTHRNFVVRELNEQNKHLGDVPIAVEI